MRSTVQGSFCHNCGRLSWYSALNVKVIGALSRSFVFLCLHASNSFLDLLSYGLSGLSPVSPGEYAPRAGRFPWFHYLDYLDCAGPHLMNGWTQLLLELKPIGVGALFVFFALIPSHILIR